MSNEVRYLEDLCTYLLNLSGLLNVLSCAWDGGLRPKAEDISYSCVALRDMLEGKAEEINKVVSEYYKTRTGEPDTEL